MSTTRQFNRFNDEFVQTLQAQTGLTLGEFTALVMSGQNPSVRSDVARFAQKLLKRREKGKRIKDKDVDALLLMVQGYMAYQELSGKDRVVFARQVLQKIIPALTSTDMATSGPGEVHSIKVDDKLRKEIRTILDEPLT